MAKKDYLYIFQIPRMQEHWEELFNSDYLKTAIRNSKLNQKNKDTALRYEYRFKEVWMTNTFEYIKDPNI